jgi:hypothetical protein
MANPRNPAGEPMTLGNMRHLGVQRLVAQKRSSVGEIEALCKLAEKVRCSELVAARDPEHLYVVAGPDGVRLNNR